MPPTYSSYRGMGGWLDDDESVMDDFVMMFVVPLAETDTAMYLRILALFDLERYSAELSTITFVRRTITSFPPFDFIFL